ncbi:DUF6385 domain-containing protein [Alicyclobacillus sp. ALC3]|uniref:DUF6385 domain-containing protein n=1 Tax=Alicyclobacillus sp. ALC3 TaxID=2796143 RepID=UPI0023786822|nr:DUF6385 domain-containing protein [Alicyclobacillus sp. ALC3]WDL95143.1 hypothetical protein JC200_11975 [Alicyclobacillus sp. ALC3]
MASTRHQATRPWVKVEVCPIKKTVCVRVNVSSDKQTSSPCHRHRQRRRCNAPKPSPIQRAQVFGKYHGTVIPVRVDRKGRLLTSPGVHSHHGNVTFREDTRNVVATHDFAPLPLQDVSHAIKYVYLVHNLGSANAKVVVQVGTDCENLAEDLEGAITIPANQVVIVTPLLFSKYVRLLYRSSSSDEQTKLHIVFQAQAVG